MDKITIVRHAHYKLRAMLDLFGRLARPQAGTTLVVAQVVLPLPVELITKEMSVLEPMHLIQQARVRLVCICFAILVVI